MQKFIFPDTLTQTKDFSISLYIYIKIHIYIFKMFALFIMLDFYLIFVAADLSLDFHSTM